MRFISPEQAIHDAYAVLIPNAGGMDAFIGKTDRQNYNDKIQSCVEAGKIISAVEGLEIEGRSLLRYLFAPEYLERERFSAQCSMIARVSREGLLADLSAPASYKAQILSLYALDDYRHQQRGALDRDWSDGYKPTPKYGNVYFEYLPAEKKTREMYQICSHGNFQAQYGKVWEGMQTAIEAAKRQAIKPVSKVFAEYSQKVREERYGNEH